MNDTLPTGNKPDMTYKDMTWHLVQVGKRARAAAAARSGDPANPDNLMTTGLKLGKDIEMQPLALATIWALEKVGSPYVGANDGLRPVSMGDIAIAVACFVSPVEVFNLAKRGQHDTIESLAMEAAELLVGPKLKAAQSFMESEFLKQRGDDEGAEAAGKSKAGEASQPPVAPTIAPTQTAGS